MCSKAHTALTAPLVLHRTSIDKYAMRIFGINSQCRNIFLLIVIHHFLHMLRAYVNCAKTVHNGIIKTHNFLRFPIAKGGTNTIAHLPVADGLSF